MKAISTRFVGPTNRLPARVVASDMDGNRATVAADGDFPYDDAHRAAAVALCVKMSWPGADTLIDGGVAHGRVWVFAPDRAELVGVIRVLVGALDDASSVVDKGEDEAYAYEAELELGRSVLARAAGEMMVRG